MRKYIGVFFLFLSLNVQAFDAIKLDMAVSTFLNKWFADTCANIEYSFLYALYVDMAYERNFYADGVHPSNLSPPELMTDIAVAVEINICDRQDGYLITFREEADGYSVVGYTSFSQPE